MENNRVLIKKDVKEEVEFAIAHNASINVFHVEGFLQKGIVQEICDELGVDASLRPNITDTQAYYVLNFFKGTDLVASYYGNNLISGEMNFACKPAEFKVPAEVIDLDGEE